MQSSAVNCSFSDNVTPLGGIIYFDGDGTKIVHFYRKTNSKMSFTFNAT